MSVGHLTQALRTSVYQAVHLLPPLRIHWLIEMFFVDVKIVTITAPAK